jgi:hypothetical protein
MQATPGSSAAPEAGVQALRGSWRVALRRAAVCLGISIAAIPLLAAVNHAAGEQGPIIPLGFVGVTLFSLVGAWFAGVAVVRALRTRPRRAGLVSVAGITLFALHSAMAALGVFTALQYTDGGRGRQLRRFGRALLPRLRPGRDWSRPEASTQDEGSSLRSAQSVWSAIDASARSALAAQWRENARTEHASVGAFAALTMDLLALGAPPELIAAAHRDGLDEIRHAQMCFALATAIDGANVSPAPFPESRRARSLPRIRILALARLAVDSLVDGVLHEGLSARTLARLARLAEVPRIREMVTELAADEGRHAAHAWHVVQWCVSAGGAPVVHALLGAARALPLRAGAGARQEAQDGAWQRWGIPGRALEVEEYAAARAGALRRVEALASPNASAQARAA